MKEAGILLHISSLPGKYGIGTLGKCAYDFVDFLAKSGQKIWQILPIGPTSYGDSPYSSLSAFAYNTNFIDLDLLFKDKLISESDLPKEKEVKRVNFNEISETNAPIFHKAYLNKKIYETEFNQFKVDHDYWLTDYAMFILLKDEQEKRSFDTWYDDFKYRRYESLEWLKNEYKDRLDEIKFIQFIFFKQAKALRKYANKKGVKIMGDMPIYCAYDSADVWAHKELFLLDDRLMPKAVAGCPPDFFSEDGQLWGNPLYNYKKMEEDKFSFWVKRVKHSFLLFDILRIDHFRGFAGYYSIPFGDTTARNGHWEVGPGYKLFKEIKKAVPNANIVAENLGFLTKDVFKLLDKCGYPGMKIFQFELGNGKNAPIKKGFAENNIFYTGTHDNQTIMSFYNTQNELYKNLIDKECNISFFDRPNLKIIEYAFNTNCNMVIIPLQDYLGLSDMEGRMNLPSTISTSNWSYISKKCDFTKDLINYIKDLTIKTNRME